MVKFLFWNINRKSLGDVVARAAAEHNVDVLILAESPYGDATTLLALLRQHEPLFDFPLAPANDSKVQIYTRFDRSCLEPARDEPRLTIRRLVLAGRQTILLAALHAPDQGSFSGNSQHSESVRLARYVQEQEACEGHQRTLLVGDFNMNPFDAGMVSTEGFHAVMSRDVARSGSRTVMGQELPIFLQSHVEPLR